MLARLLFVLLLVANVPGNLNAAEPIFPADAKLEKLHEGFGLSEGVAVAHDGQVYFSDITFSHQVRNARGEAHAGHIWRYDPTTGRTTVFRSPSGKSNGIKFDAAGDMIVCEGADYGGRRVTRTKMKTGLSYVLAGLFEGQAFNSPNDLSLDERGRIYFTDPRYLGREPLEQPVMAVYRIDTDGSIKRIITDASKPNGVCVSPDQKTLYIGVNDNGATAFDRLAGPDGKLPPLTPGRMALLAYDLHADGTAKFRQTLVDFAPQHGPDGLTCDADGNLYVAVRDETRPGIRVYSPTGEELAYLKTELPTNVAFARGDSSHLLYLTAGSSLYRIATTRRGYHPK